MRDTSERTSDDTPGKTWPTTLEDLHDELSQADEVDQDTLGHLKLLIEDIQKLLSNSATPASEEGTASNRWQDLLLKFQSRHPHLADLLDQITDGLSGLGI